MEIYVVQPGDNINSIAQNYGVSVTKLIQDNGLPNPESLVTGQTLVILFPEQIHIVQEGDTLTTIANAYGITLMQLLRNNSFLLDREYIYPGETIVISYNLNGKVSTNGYAYNYINKKTLIKSLLYLTYLSIFNYRVSVGGEIISFGDETEIIQVAKDYGVVPLMTITSFSPQGEPNVEAVNDLLLNEDNQNKLISNVLNILKTKSYSGLNMMLSEINENNQQSFLNFTTKISNTLKNEGYLLFITINPNIQSIGNEISFEQIDYLSISKMVNGLMFLQYSWGVNLGPPSPVSSINLIRDFVDYVVKLVPPEEIFMGKPLIAYDWALPYVPGKSIARSLTLDSAIALAIDESAIIQFDETSQTPFFVYSESFLQEPIDHIVWFIDARSINALTKLIAEYGLQGTGVWNIMIYYQQLWSIINSQYEIIKVVPDMIQ